MFSSFINNYQEIIIVDALISCIVIVFYFYQVKKINTWIGYRTNSSMKSQASWTFSQRYFFKRWIYILPIIYGMQFILLDHYSNRFVTEVSMGLFVGYSILLIIITEKKIKKTLD
ncbi:SdpI family protein [Myroides sp. LJL115]